MFTDLLIFLFGQGLYDVLLSDYPVLLAVFCFLCFNTILFCFSYFVKNCITVWR